MAAAGGTTLLAGDSSTETSIFSSAAVAPNSSVRTPEWVAAALAAAAAAAAAPPPETAAPPAAGKAAAGGKVAAGGAKGAAASKQAAAASVEILPQDVPGARELARALATLLHTAQVYDDWKDKATVYALPAVGEPGNSDSMSLYRHLLSGVPPERQTVPLVLDAILQQVTRAGCMS